ncbi:MAG: hypothetical protein E6I65_03425 [Chloroflexi bacterium]|nr:MAG: hypothetical protein E6I65_03425 [Chloroflexota bacterium]
MDTPDREPEPLRTTQPGDAPPPAAEAGGMRAYTWEWGREDDRRPRLPWIGIFLLVYGALLLVERLVPQYLTQANLLVLAAGLAFLILWLLRRGTFSLYAGAFLTASAVPGLIKSLGYTAGTGVGTLAYGVAFLFIALVRASRGGGIGWQAVIGIILVALGGSELALPDAASLVLPILLVAFGLVLLTRQRS